MEGAYSLCEARFHTEFMPVYWRLKLLKQLKLGVSDLRRYK